VPRITTLESTPHRPIRPVSSQLLQSFALSPSSEECPEALYVTLRYYSLFYRQDPSTHALWNPTGLSCSTIHTVAPFNFTRKDLKPLLQQLNSSKQLVPTLWFPYATLLEDWLQSNPQGTLPSKLVYSSIFQLSRLFLSVFELGLPPPVYKGFNMLLVEENSKPIALKWIPTDYRTSPTALQDALASFLDFINEDLIALSEASTKAALQTKFSVKHLEVTDLWKIVEDPIFRPC